MSVERDNLIAAAVRERKIAADREADYRRMWNADPAVIRRLLTARVADGGLAAGQVVAGSSPPAAPAEPDGYPREWFGDGDMDMRRNAGRVFTDE